LGEMYRISFCRSVHTEGFTQIALKNSNIVRFTD
jgi:hypothetical protein